MREPNFLDKVKAETTSMKPLTQITGSHEIDEAQMFYETKIAALFSGIKIEQDVSVRNEATKLLEKYLAIAEELQKIHIRALKGKSPIEGPHARKSVLEGCEFASCYLRIMFMLVKAVFKIYFFAVSIL